jgi:acyl carrier protein phosphodiesterase
MNFLAHAYLAGDEPALIVGGLVGDWVKGPLPGALPQDLARGVALHRAIDAHAERHPAFRASRARVSPARRRYAGVLVDIFYDHLLAHGWANYHAQPLDAYSASVYALVAARLHEIPRSAHFCLQLMVAEDWLAGYAQFADIATILARMARRARQPNPLTGGEEEFAAHAAGFATDFAVWLVDAKHHAQDWCVAAGER